jgi:2-polyprenyl-6-hydroxyphenyl methylase/3-demethylubiquinone-9 3-methyltransferase
MLQYRLLERSPRLLRWYRTRLTLDWGRLLKYLPAHGRVLDVGCGVGSLDYEIGRTCMIKVLGIDVNPTSIDFARRYHSRPNVEFAAVELDAVEGLFDCVLFVDVFHHVPPAEHKSLLDTCVRLLAPGGYVLIKDIERRRGHVSRWMDRYLSGCDDVYMYNCDELRERVSAVLPVLSSEVRFKPPFPHYYLKAGYASA